MDYGVYIFLCKTLLGPLLSDSEIAVYVETVSVNEEVRLGLSMNLKLMQLDTVIAFWVMQISHHV